MPADYLSRNVVEAISWETQDLQRAQENDNDKALKNSLETQNARHWLCILQMTGSLKRVKRKFEPSRVVIFLPESLVSQVLQEAHGHLLLGHENGMPSAMLLLARNGCRHRVAHPTLSQLPNSQKELETWTNTCLFSAADHWANQLIHADLFGPLQTSGNGKQMILVVTDAFTKYVQLVAIPNKEAATMAKDIFEHWICRFGVPLEIVTD